MKILLLAGNTLRAKAYAQALSNDSGVNNEIIGLLYGPFNEESTPPTLNSETESFLIKNQIFTPDFNESIENTFTKNNWSYKRVENRDVNSQEVLQQIEKTQCDLIVFAGYGGQLLGKEHFQGEAQYLHMHPGKLPFERGSTTLYYSILNERKCTVTAFFMTEKIDAGKNILFREFNVPSKNVDIDRYYDNLIRANCFVEAIKKLNKDDFTLEDNIGESEEYYVIHPVLKHCALLSLKKD